MNKYLMAFLACLGIFILLVLFQVFVAKGILVGILFYSAMVGAWKGIVRSNDKKNQQEKEEQQQQIAEENDINKEQ
jgi:predicted membrane protein